LKRNSSKLQILKIRTEIKDYEYNSPIDVSSSKDGICVITKKLQLCNSHAGTHCDLPGHFVKNPKFKEWDDFQVNGPCVVLDLTNKEKKNIEIEDIKDAIGSIELESITRLLLNTYGKNIPKEWDKNPAFLSVECAEYLGGLSNLLLVGIDTPSVDHQNASPIIKCSHGGLWKGRIAIMENLDFSCLEYKNVEGFLQTKWNNYQISEDAKGCFVTFFKKLK
jgi:kynurenine formamidase